MPPSADGGSGTAAAVAACRWPVAPAGPRRRRWRAGGRHRRDRLGQAARRRALGQPDVDVARAARRRDRRARARRPAHLARARVASPKISSGPSRSSTTSPSSARGRDPSTRRRRAPGRRPPRARRAAPPAPARRSPSRPPSRRSREARPPPAGRAAPCRRPPPARCRRRTAIAAGRCSITAISARAGSPGVTSRSRTSGIGGHRPVESVVVHVQGGHRARRAREGCAHALGVAVVRPVIRTSSTATNEESRSQNWYPAVSTVTAASGDQHAPQHPRREGRQRHGGAGQGSSNRPHECPGGPTRPHGRGTAPRARARRRSAPAPAAVPRPSERSRRRWWPRPCSPRSSRASRRSGRRRRRARGSRPRRAARRRCLPSARGSSGFLNVEPKVLMPEGWAARRWARISASVAFTARARPARARTRLAPRSRAARGWSAGS